MSAAAQTVDLAEWGERLVDGVHLTGADVALLGREDGKRFEIDDLHGGLRIRAKSWVGVIRLTNIEIRVRPKLAGGEDYLLKMIDRVSGIDSLTRLLGRLAIDAADHHLLDLFVTLLCDACEHLIRAGLLADYVEHEEELGVVRGRLLVERQVLQRFGRVDRLICRHDEHQTDIVENQILGAVLRHAGRHARAHTLRHRAGRLADAFAEVCDPDAVDLASARGTIGFHRGNAHYRDAHAVAWIVLDGLGVRDLHAAGPTDCFAFLIDMNSLFEDFVGVVVRLALSGRDVSVHQQRRDGSVLWDVDHGRSYGRVIPDLLVAWGSGARLPIDAKYKLYDDRKAESADIYQAFLYAMAYGDARRDAVLPRALLIFPSPQKTVTDERIQIRRSGGPAVSEVSVVGIPIAALLDDPAGCGTCWTDVAGAMIQPPQSAQGLQAEAD